MYIETHTPSFIVDPSFIVRHLLFRLILKSWSKWNCLNSPDTICSLSTFEVKYTTNSNENLVILLVFCSWTAPYLVSAFYSITSNYSVPLIDSLIIIVQTSTFVNTANNHITILYVHAGERGYAKLEPVINVRRSLNGDIHTFNREFLYWDCSQTYNTLSKSSPGIYTACLVPRQTE